LLLLAAIHAMPLLGVLGAAKLSSLYGITVQDANLDILMRHRAVQFGLLAALLGYAAFRKELHRLGLIAASASVGTFLLLAYTVGSYNQAIHTVVIVDIAALVLLAVGVAVHFIEAARHESKSH
jgi:ABC-type proline/glycine betaine transport system permease subunit